jgi:hypothetical protein
MTACLALPLVVAAARASESPADLARSRVLERAIGLMAGGPRGLAIGAWALIEEDSTTQVDERSVQ